MQNNMMQPTFELKPEHIALLRSAYWNYQNCEYGAPEIDPKRPYGNSDVEGDVREILNLPDLSDEEADALHHETVTAIEVILSTKTFEPGVYERRGDGYRESRDWTRVDNPTQEQTDKPFLGGTIIRHATRAISDAVAGEMYLQRELRKHHTTEEFEEMSSFENTAKRIFEQAVIGLAKLPKES